ncbi:acyltransferase domain-containing protein [Solirubrobacter soli]|uniref:acyltransferase domain-containing protein n=1 Tax=Solirubrobacter soli TaxID=363832 RepID=UPI00040541C5|nr:acyltransferase domain-containing protein [Solirubrobacter soli]
MRIELPFVYSGMGAQWWGMGGELYVSEPVFRAAVDRCAGLDPAVLRGFSGDGTPMVDPADAQPSGLALQVGLTELWRARGVQPSAVVGHSFGELAAAWAAGALTLEQAFELAHHRSRLEQTLVGSGGMVAVTSIERELPPGVEIAAVNGRNSFTLTGDVDAIEGKRLNVSVPYHSRHAEPLSAAFERAVGRIRARTPRIPFFSTVAGARLTDRDYWWRNLREPTRFDVALTHLRAFVEIGPHPVLAALMPGAVGSMRRKRSQVETFEAALRTAKGGEPGPHVRLHARELRV